MDDDFAALHHRMLDADAYILVSPVYWGDLSETAKAFMDRVRRCEAALIRQ
jgi:multimeric flavodoxin WrbA